MFPHHLLPSPTSHQCAFETQPTPNETILPSPCLATREYDTVPGSRTAGRATTGGGWRSLGTGK